MPFTFFNDYRKRVPNVELRTLEDTRTDFDALLYGGGKVDWGFAWSLFFNAFVNKKTTMAYGIGLRTDQIRTHFTLIPMYADFFRKFNAIAVRDGLSNFMLKAQHVESQLTACPAVNLKEEKSGFGGDYIVACPRYGDFDANGNVDNKAQVEWFLKRLASEERVVLVPFHPRDREGAPRDLELCQEICKWLGSRCITFPCDGYNARKVKHLISQSRLVISGGRYHAIAWAIAHDIPHEIAPTIGEPALTKLNGLTKISRESLLEGERNNKRIFEEITA